MCGSVAVEGAGGLGHLLAQQLVAAGEQVLDVQPKLGAQVRKARLCCPLMPDEAFSKVRRSVLGAGTGGLRRGTRHSHDVSMTISGALGAMDLSGASRA